MRARTEARLAERGLSAEIELAGDVRYFLKYLPPRRTDKEELAVRYVDHLRSKDEKRTPPSRQRELELTR